MVATHSVKINGKWYKAGEEIAPAMPVTEVKLPVVEEAKESPKHTKREITFMKVDDLRTLAAEQGIETPESKTGAELKKLLIEKLGL